MSDMHDFKTTALPKVLMAKIATASANGYCRIDSNGDGDEDKDVSAYLFLEDLAKHPEHYAKVWKAVLADMGVAAAGDLGFFSIAAVSGPLAPFAILGAIIAAPFFGSNRIATLVIGNQTDGAMHQKEIYQDCGFQSGRPVFSETDATTGSVIATHPGMIPGKVKLGDDNALSGLGLYRFEKDLSLGIGFYGTAGAISFTFDDPKITSDMAIGWSTPQSGKPYYAATNNLGHYSSLKDFYDKTIDVRASGAGELPGFEYTTRGMQAAIAKAYKAQGLTGNAPPGPCVIISEKEREWPDKADDCDMLFTATFYNDAPGDDDFG